MLIKGFRGLIKGVFPFVSLIEELVPPEIMQAITSGNHNQILNMTTTVANATAAATEEL